MKLYKEDMPAAIAATKRWQNAWGTSLLGAYLGIRHDARHDYCTFEEAREYG